MLINDIIKNLRIQYLPQIAALLDSLPQEACPQAATLTAECAYQLATGGKRLRAILPLVVANAFGQDPAALLPFAAACEMLHNATLVHDDVQDGDEVRRGQPTVWKKYGMPAAINCGDAMFYYAILLLQKLAIPAEDKNRLCQLFISETLKVINGQELEFALQEATAPTMENYAVMVEGKTSGLFALPTVGAAILCGANAEAQSALREATKHLGVLFQIQDDYLDIYGQKGRTFAGSDIAEGKRSFLALHALTRATTADSRELLSILNTPRENTSPEMIARAIAIFNSTGTPEAAQQEIARRRQLALAAVQNEPFYGAYALIDGMADLLTGKI